ncbi:MAG: hypothetical protein HUU37_03115 [Bdellovibrionales bacterium]|nr:hypothetical protein [Bdellovibrionales bacterium]
MAITPPDPSLSDRSATPSSPEACISTSKIFLVLILICLSPLARAADPAGGGALSEAEGDGANPFSDYVPPPEDSDVSENEHFQYFGNQFGIMVGTGIQWFDGNMGRLYNAAALNDNMSFRWWWLWDFRFMGTIGYTRSKHRFDAYPVGDTQVPIRRIDLDFRYFFDAKNLSATFTAMHPFALLGFSNVKRSQLFEDLGSIEAESKMAASVGGGLQFDITPRSTRLDLELKYSRTIFRDAEDQTFVPVGIPNLRGSMYSFTTSVMWMF